MAIYGQENGRGSCSACFSDLQLMTVAADVADWLFFLRCVGAKSTVMVVIDVGGPIAFDARP